MSYSQDLPYNDWTWVPRREYRDYTKLPKGPLCPPLANGPFCKAETDSSYCRVYGNLNPKLNLKN